MTRLFQARHLLIYTVPSVLLLLSSVLGQCNTDQNPYCRGDSTFEAICCPYPNVCYWTDREGNPGCCAAGQVCLDGGGGVVTPPVEPPTIYSTVTPTSRPLSTITSYVSNPPTGGAAGGGGVVVTTTTQGPVEGAWSTVTSDIGGAFDTVTSEVAGGFETVTSTIGAIATEAATDIVQVLNGRAENIDVRQRGVIAAVVGVVVLLV